MEIEEHEDEILQKAGLSKAQFDTILTILFAKIVVVSEMVISNKMKQARKIMDRIDPNDTPFIALALATQSDGIWTEDKHFEKQNEIKLWKTKDILSLTRNSQ